MIALDSSALVSIAIEEAGFEIFEAAVSSHRCIVGAPTLQETHMVLCGKEGVDPIIFVERLLAFPTISIVPFGADHFGAARRAFDAFGKGGGHPAKLNFGDCMAYAIAKVADAPLLYKGVDFAHTDIKPALKP